MRVWLFMAFGSLNSGSGGVQYRVTRGPRNRKRGESPLQSGRTAPVRYRSDVPDERDAVGRAKLTLEYDGTGFAGWAIQPGKRTVEDEVSRALSVLLRA